MPQQKILDKEHPLNLENWGIARKGLSLHEQGELLFQQWAESSDEPFQVLNSSALHRLPPDLIDHIEERMIGPEAAEERDLSADSYPISPEFSAAFNGKRYSIISAAVNLDSHEYAILVTLENGEGVSLAPSLKGPDAIMMAPTILESNSEFCGLLIRASQEWGQDEDGSFTFWDSHPEIFLGPSLEALSLVPETVRTGKIGDILESLHSEISGLKAPKVSTSYEIDPGRRAVRGVSIIHDDGSWNFFDYGQEGGVFGALSTCHAFPSQPASFKPPSTRWWPAQPVREERLQQHLGLTPLREALKPEESSLVRNLAELVVTNHFDQSQLQEITRVGFSIIGGRHEPILGGAVHFIIAASAQNAAGEFLLSTDTDKLLRFTGEVSFVSSFILRDARFRNPIRAFRSALQRIVSDSVKGVSLVRFGVCVPEDTFFAEVEKLRSRDTSGLLWSALQEQTNKALRRKGIKATTEITDIRAQLVDNPESVMQSVSLAVKHSLGFSLFDLRRHKDSGYICTPKLCSPLGLKHLDTIFAPPRSKPDKVAK